MTKHIDQAIAIGRVMVTTITTIWSLRDTDNIEVNIYATNNRQMFDVKSKADSVTDFMLETAQQMIEKHDRIKAKAKKHIAKKSAKKARKL